MKTKARILSALLLAAMLIPTMIACGSDSGNTTADTTQAAETTTVAETEPTHDENGYLLDEIPEELDFEGADVNVLGWNSYELVEFYVEDETGDILDDTVYNRNRTVEERLNVKFGYTEIDGRDNGGALLTALQASIMSGLSAYDITAFNSARTANAVSAGMYLDLFKLDYLDFEKPWWIENLLDTSVIAGKLFFATGDIAPSSITRIQGIYVNQNLCKEYAPDDDVYELVLSGDWTLAKMMNMTKGLYSDLNANGQKDEKDQFGFAADSFQLQAPYTAAGLVTVLPSDDGGLYIPESAYGDRACTLLETLCSFMHGSSDAISVSKVDDRSMFSEGRAMFFGFVMRALASADMRDLEFDTGFVPWPKYDENDDEYTISSSTSFSLFAVPLDAKDPDMSAAALETLASEGYRQVAPALFEICYKVKYNNDTSERQSKVFDLLRLNRAFDIGRIFTYQVSFSALSQFGNMAKSNNPNWASTYAANLEATQNQLNELVERIRELPQ